MFLQVFLVGVGGAVGSVFRYLTSLWTIKYYTKSFPLATFLVNILGCLLIGIFVGFIGKNQELYKNLRYLLITGFCGGFTTFSTFSLENLTLVQNGSYWIAFLYTFLSVILGFIAVWLGLSMAKF